MFSPAPLLRDPGGANRDRGDQHSWPSPSHTTRHAGPHRAVGAVEVNGIVILPSHCPRSLPEDSAKLISRCREPRRLHPRSYLGELCLRKHLRQSNFDNPSAHSPTPSALRLPATMASADFSLRLAPSPFQAQGEISPGKNALLHCTTAGFTPLRLDHESFAVSCPLALFDNAFYPVLVHRLAASIHASSPHSVTLMQLRFTSFAVINSRWDFHPQECAHAGRTRKPRLGGASSFGSL